SFFLKIRDVLVYRGQRAQPHALLDFFIGGRVLMSLHKLRDKVVDLPLPSGDCHRRIVGEYSAKSTGTLGSGVQVCAPCRDITVSRAEGGAVPRKTCYSAVTAFKK